MACSWPSLSRLARLQACVVIEKVVADSAHSTISSGTANRKIELAVSSALIDGDFGKSVRVLVPECRARRLIAEGPRALQQSTAATSRASRGSMIARSPLIALP